MIEVETTFTCSECGETVIGTDLAISMTINCPGCEKTTTAYKR